MLHLVRVQCCSSPLTHSVLSSQAQARANERCTKHLSEGDADAHGRKVLGNGCEGVDTHHQVRREATNSTETSASGNTQRSTLDACDTPGDRPLLHLSDDVGALLPTCDMIVRFRHLIAPRTEFGMEDPPRKVLDFARLELRKESSCGISRDFASSRGEVPEAWLPRSASLREAALAALARVGAVPSDLRRRRARVHISA